MARYALLRLSAQTPQAKPIAEVSVVPIIDISLVLLVILFVTAPLLSYPTLPVNLPAADQPADQELSVAVTLAPDGALFVRAAPSSWSGLAADLRREVSRRPNAVVLVRADKSAPYRALQRLLAAAKEAGASRVALAVAPPSP